MKKRIVSLGLALVMMMSFLFVFAPTSAAASQFYVTTANLHLRAAPSTDADSFGVLPHGARVMLVSYHNSEWYLVHVVNALTIHNEWIVSQEGFMAAEFLAPAPPAAEFPAGVSWLIEPRWGFDAVFPFNEGMAGVEVFEGEDEWSMDHILGYMNRRGEMVIPMVHHHWPEVYGYRGAPPFSEGRVVMHSREQGGVGVFDNHGNLVVPFIYNWGWTFSHGLAAVQVGEPWGGGAQWGFINPAGAVVIPFQFDAFTYDFSPQRVPTFSEGLAAVYRATGSGWREGAFGFIDIFGNLVVPHFYDYARDFNEGRAAVAMGDWEWTDDAVWGFIDHMGNEIVPLQYSRVNDFSEGLATAFVGDWSNRQAGFIDLSGNVVIPFGRFEDADSFSEGLAAARLTGGDWNTPNWGFIDRSGNTVVPHAYSNVSRFSDGMAAVMIGDWDVGMRWGFVDASGNEIVPPVYDMVSDFSYGLAAVRVGDWDTGRWGFIDRAGNVVVPIAFDDVRPFSEGLAWVRQGNLWGILQVHGNVQAPVATPEPQQPQQPVNVGNYIIEPTLPHIQFTPQPNAIANVRDADTAQAHIRDTVQGLTFAQRTSGDALSLAALHIENTQRRGTSQNLPANGHIGWDAIAFGIASAHQLQAYTDMVLEEQNMHLLRDLRRNINFVADTLGTNRLNLILPQYQADVDFDNLTIEADFLAITINRAHMPAGATISISTEGNGAMVTATPTFTGILAHNLADFSSPLIILANYWSVLVILALVFVWLILRLNGKRLRVLVVPIFAVIFLGANVATIYLFGDVPTSMAHTAYGDSIVVDMPMGMQMTLSLPTNGAATPENTVLLNSRGQIQRTKYNPITNTIDAIIEEPGVFTLVEPYINIVDIGGKSPLMQDAITRLVSLGIMYEVENVDNAMRFDPDEVITREEFRIAVENALGLPSWNIQLQGDIEGGIPKDQMSVVMANVLMEHMGYAAITDPFEIDQILARYLDRHDIAPWAEASVALVTMADVLIFRADGMFAPDSVMTRGDAAVVIYRLFNRVW